MSDLHPRICFWKLADLKKYPVEMIEGPNARLHKCVYHCNGVDDLCPYYAAPMKLDCVLEYIRGKITMAETKAI